MGYWLGTCMVSNLPIHDSEKVKVFILEKSKYGGKHSGAITYPIDEYVPLSLPLNAKYNGYGSVEKVEEDFNHDIILSYFKSDYSKLKDEDGKEILLDDEFSLEYFIKIMERLGCSNKDQFFYDTIKGEYIKKNFAIVMVRDDIYNSISESSKDSIDFMGDTFYDKSLKNIKKEIHSIKNNEMFFDSFYTRYGHIFNIDIIYDYKKYIKNNLENLDYYIKTTIDYLLFISYLNTNRICYRYTSGAGSQNFDYKSFVKVAETIINICEEKIKEEEGYYED